MVYDGNGNPQNWLIDSITPDADALTYTIKIKEGIKFSDGSDLNADAGCLEPEQVQGRGRYVRLALFKV